jgi:3-deoxy-D-manno-octulosonate 8-phosphate phosphatase (KDO 8-P phosphatase)
LKKNIRALVLDIDGVLTDGTVGVNESSRKRVFLRDLDALTVARGKGIQIAFLSGESEHEAKPVVDCCGGGIAIYDAKDKEKGILEMAEKLKMKLSEICYVGDARRDIPALQIVELGLVPADADKRAKSAADRVLFASGGRGAVSEAVDIILETSDEDPE